MVQDKRLPPRHSKREISLIVVGIMFCLFGLLVSGLGLGLFSASSGAVDLPPRVSMALWILSISLIIWGASTIVFRNREAMINCNLALISMLIVTPIAAELFIRSAIYLDVEFFRNPRLYAGWSDDDDHWKLRHQWQKSEGPIEGGGFVPDPLLGWAPAQTSQNPLGILSDTDYQPDFSIPTILFYGDSYVYGMSPTPIEARVPQQLDVLLSNYTVYNYGVVGYGLDQIYLRFRQTHSAFEKPVILVGIYTLDLDRSILRVREMPKPYFEIENERLTLKGTPVPDNMEQWLEQNPVTINSYFLALLLRQYRIMSSGFQLTETPYRQLEKKELNRKVIEEIVEEANSHELPILFVVFYPERELAYTGWRETFLKEMFDRLDVPYIDTKQVFLSQPLPPAQFYDSYHGHLNQQGGMIVAQAIMKYFDE